jgi:hypothetical protein
MKYKCSNIIIKHIIKPLKALMQSSNPTGNSPSSQSHQNNSSSSFINQSFINLSPENSLISHDNNITIL